MAGWADTNKIQGVTISFFRSCYDSFQIGDSFTANRRTSIFSIVSYTDPAIDNYMHPLAVKFGSNIKADIVIVIISIIAGLLIAALPVDWSF